ncbi:hypothetical protein [Wolbachia endosymbiont of Psylliodes chrysocephala]|nr:hypothetical protein [Wolbachia endosymbiont of Psylliodes chrysocephala]
MLDTGIPKKDDVIRVALFLSSQCVTLGSNFLCKITIFIYLQIDTI